MSNQAPIPNLQPVPDEWAGYAGPKNFGNVQYGIHKAGTVVATIGTSLVATATLAVGGYESPLLNFKNEGDPEAVEVARETTSSHHPEELLWTSSKRVGERDAVRQEHQVLRGSVQMHDAPSFDVLTSPGAWRPVNPEALPSLVLNIKHAQEGGWTVTGVTREGVASDEARYDQGAGLGRANEANARLAGQYGQFAGDLFETEATRAGVNLTGAHFTETSREVVLDAGQSAAFDAEARRLGYADAGQFVVAAKANPSAMSPEAQKLMNAYISTNRGANFVVELSRPQIEKEGVYADSMATRCVTNYTTNVTTEQRTDTDTIPVLLVPMPVPKFRRRRLEQEDEALPAAWTDAHTFTNHTTKRKRPQWAKDVNTMRRERQEDGLAWYGEYGVSENPKIGLPKEESVQPDKRKLPAKQQPTGETKIKDSYVSLDELIRRSRRSNRIAGWGAAVVLAGLAATLRFDALSCPDGELWTDTFPGFSAGFEIPFTDIKTPKMVILDPYCSVDSNEGVPSEPTCDTRYYVYENGHLIHKEETSYPGAITVTEGLPR